MNNYLDNIQSMDFAGTDAHGQPVPDSTPILVVSGDVPALTYAERPDYTEEISQDSISYSAPQKVTVRKYRLRK